MVLGWGNRNNYMSLTTNYTVQVFRCNAYEVKFVETNTQNVHAKKSIV